MYVPVPDDPISTTVNCPCLFRRDYGTARFSYRAVLPTELPRRVFRAIFVVPPLGLYMPWPTSPTIMSPVAFIVPASLGQCALTARAMAQSHQWALDLRSATAHRHRCHVIGFRCQIHVASSSAQPARSRLSSLCLRLPWRPRCNLPAPLKVICPDSIRKPPKPIIAPAMFKGLLGERMVTLLYSSRRELIMFGPVPVALAGVDQHRIAVWLFVCDGAGTR